jgi:hypothetical protein
MSIAELEIPETELDAVTHYSEYEADDYAVEETTVKSCKLPARWYPLRPHTTQIAFEFSKERFNVVAAGRRSGKTERAKRRFVRKCLSRRKNGAAYYLIGAPTYGQVKRIYWKDIKLFIPEWCIAGRISESELSIPLVTGALIQLVGLDRPARVEGPPVEHVLIDEDADCDPDVWPEHIRPMLADTGGSADRIGAPEGRNHFFRAFQDGGIVPGWASFHWKSDEILPAAEIEAAKRDLDELTYKQEYEADFVTFSGLAYHSFVRERHATIRLPYKELEELIFAFDFNVAPGVAAVGQEHDRYTDWISEVHIPRNSNTILVCDKLIEKFGNHKGRVRCYGDATGGAKGSAKVQGSDWDLIKGRLRPVFGDRLIVDVPNENPRERSRINAVNSRLKSMSDEIHMRVDPVSCPNIVRDFESVSTIEGSAGVIDKSDSTITHLSDAIGYYVVRKFPVRIGGGTSVTY